MARRVKKKKFSETPLGTVLTIAAYVVMLLLILMFFDGNGAFIYEGF